MSTNLNLVKSEEVEVEKRIFPRFPFTFMTFKDEEQQDAKVFEVLDISLTGMRLCLKNGGHTYNSGSSISGELHWRGVQLKIVGSVKWVGALSVGVIFNIENDLTDKIKSFLSLDNIIRSMKPLHKSGLDLDIPSNLKYWLRADGPFEIFLWQHNDGELSRFQVIMMDQFIEWEDGKGVRTGFVIKRRDINSPLHFEDEFLFEMDNITNENKVNEALGLVERIPDNYIPQQAVEFLCVKLGGHPIATPC